MNLLVTGGTGFLGKATALRLKGLGHSVSVVGRNASVGAELQRESLAQSHGL